MSDTNDPANDPNLNPEVTAPQTDPTRVYEDAPMGDPTPLQTQAVRGTAPPNVNPDVDPTTQSVFLPRILADEYGMSGDNARNTVLEGTITIDGDRYDGDKLAVPYDVISGKEVTISGPYRAVRFTFNG